MLSQKGYKHSSFLEFKTKLNNAKVYPLNLIKNHMVEFSKFIQ